MRFLETIAVKYIEEYGDTIHRLAFVFPTRRACLYFRRHLQKRNEPGTPAWAPHVFSIGDFMTRLSKFTAADQLDLIFELYRIYKDRIQAYPKEFEDFYAWGKMILSDFDEIDKYLIDTGELFRTLKEFKAVEDINKDSRADIYNRYTGFWGDLGELYREFNRFLDEKNKAYEGRAFREVAENIQTIAESFEWEKVIFCGLNAISGAEQVIISHLLENEKAEIYWDMDRYFVEDKDQEAGHFFRKNVKSLKLAEPMWVDDRLSEPKHIKLIGVQSKVGQAKVLGLMLDKLLREEGTRSRQAGEDPETTAVVLPDEVLLFPVLNSLPESVTRINITLGFPLQQTPVFSLFNAIIEMHLRVFEGGEMPPPIIMGPGGKKKRAARKKAAVSEGFYYKDIRQVLNHPYIKPAASEEIGEFLDKITKDNTVYVPEKDIHFKEEALNRLFRLPADSPEVIDFFLELLDFIRVFYSESESGEGPVDRQGILSVDYEYIYHFYTLLSRLRDSLRSTELPMDIRTFRQLFTDIVQNSRIPFTGEPLEGLQVMGMLETQTLDFTNVFVLSVNEGHLPPGKTHQSFIPFEVRAAVGMPTYKDRDAVAAYHFYRLLKSSRNITLIYTTEARGIEKSEKSRFIDQVLIEYAERNKNAVIEHQVIDFGFDAQPVKEISIAKTDRLMAILPRLKYSASSLLTYLTCPLQFYFSYILKFKEEEEVYESPEYYQIGHIMHKALEDLYKPYLREGSPVGVGDIDAIKEKIEKRLAAAYSKELGAADIHSGRHKIVFEVMRAFLNNFFEKEKRDCGFRVLMLEKKVASVDFPFTLEGSKYRVKLSGTVDRLDEKDGKYRIIDYKTGRIHSLNLNSLDELSGPGVVDRREVFQLFFYRYLVRRLDLFSGDYRLGIYPFKKMYDELAYVKVDKSDVIDEGMVDEFEAILGEIFRGLFDRGRPFVQTSDMEVCRYCPYQDICSRGTGER